jgi:hypothetical protein
MLSDIRKALLFHSEGDAAIEMLQKKAAQPLLSPGPAL